MFPQHPCDVVHGCFSFHGCCRACITPPVEGNDYIQEGVLPIVVKALPWAVTVPQHRRRVPPPLGIDIPPPHIPFLPELRSIADLGGCSALPAVPILPPLSAVSSQFVPKMHIHSHTLMCQILFKASPTISYRAAGRQTESGSSGHGQASGPLRRALESTDVTTRWTTTGVFGIG